MQLTGGDCLEDFEALYRQYAKQLFRYLVCLSGDRQLAEELLQETFYQAINSIFRFKGNSKVSTWLYQIAKNVYLKHISKARKGRMTSLDDIENVASPELLDAAIIEEEQNSNLTAALNKLNDPFREIICLRVFNELSFKEVGELFSRSEGWARTTFYRAKLQLRAFLSDDFSEVS
jgi:RNA polymerase sigma-70 factor, ECF subfamily